MSINDWSDMMPHTVTYEKVTARNVYGAPTAYAALQIYTARVQYALKRITGPNGQDESSTVQVWLADALTAINMDDRFVLPGGRVPLLVSWEIVNDERGAHHTKLYFR